MSFKNSAAGPNQYNYQLTESDAVVLESCYQPVTETADRPGYQLEIKGTFDQLQLFRDYIHQALEAYELSQVPGSVAEADRLVLREVLVCLPPESDRQWSEADSNRKHLAA